MAATHESLAMLAAVRALDLDGVASDVEIEETRAALRDARGCWRTPWRTRRAKRKIAPSSGRARSRSAGAK